MSSWIVFAGRVATMAVGAVALMVGCSSSTDGGSSVTADDACNQLAIAYCDKAQSCAGSFIGLAYGDATTCKSRALASCKMGLSAPGTSAVPGDTAACAKAVTSLACGDLLDNALPAACQPKAGGIADGAGCIEDAQCKSGFCALDGDKAVCGKCAAKPAEGGACPDGKCPSGLKCSRKNTCSKVVADGGACDDTKPCATGSSCVKSVCTKDVATAGAACDETLATGPTCDGAKGLVCLAKKCVQATFAADGAACGFEVDTKTLAITSFTICGKGGYCKGVDLAAKPPVLKGTCVPAAKDGEACVADASTIKGPGCLEPAECVAGKCQLADGATCK